MPTIAELVLDNIDSRNVSYRLSEGCYDSMDMNYLRLYAGNATVEVNNNTLTVSYRNSSTVDTATGRQQILSLLDRVFA